MKQVITMIDRYSVLVERKLLEIEVIKVYLELVDLLEKSKKWKDADLKAIEDNKIKLEKAWEIINVKNAEKDLKKMDW